jgi:hypothetical protein
MTRTFTLTVYDINTGDIEHTQTYPTLEGAQNDADLWDLTDFEVSIESNLEVA